MEGNTRDMILQVLRSRPIAYRRDFAEIGGGALPGLFLSQLFYWHDKGYDPDGWIDKTQKEWLKETGLTRSEQETARGKLMKRGLIEEGRNLIGKRYRPVIDKIVLMLESSITKCDSSAESDITKSANPADRNGVSRHSSIAENTSETTNIKKAVKKPPVKKGRKKPPDGSTQDLAVKWCSHVGIKIETLVWQDWVALKAMSKAEIGIDTLIEMSKKAWAKKKHNLTYLNNERASLLVGIQKSESEEKNGRRYGSHLDLIEKENQKS